MTISTFDASKQATSKKRDCGQDGLVRLLAGWKLVAVSCEPTLCRRDQY